MRLRNKVLIVTCAALSLLAVTELLPSSAAALSQAPTQRVIVVLKNQAPSLPATRAQVSQRRASFQSSQAPVLSQLSSSGARSVHSYTVLDAVSATVSPNELARLTSSPAVSKVVPDQIIRIASPQISGAGAAGQGAAAAASGTTPVPGACAPSGKVQLDPEALDVMHADSDTPGAKTARSLGLTGSGVSVAFIADGLDIDNPDFVRANGQHVFTDYKDFSGQGTSTPTGGGEAFLDASSIAAQGLHTYDISHYSDLPLNQPCNIRIEGVAPGASLVGLSIFGAENAGFNSQFLQAIDYAVSVDHVNVLNESLGNNYYPDDAASLDLIKQANDNAVAAGTTVTVSSGDAGVTSTIGTPSTDPNVISAGASTTYRLDAQIGYGGGHFPGVTGWLDNDVSSFSSGGFEQDGRTVDLVAPGELNWALCSTDTTQYSECTNYAGQRSPVQATGGTSESAPLTAGEAALVIQAYRQTHGGATPSPALVKQLIVSNTDDIGSPAEQQGAGLADAYKASLAAEQYNGAPASTAAGAAQTGVLSDSQTQLNATDQPGTAEHLTDTFTNESGSAQTLSLSSRRLGAYQSLRTASVTLSDSGSPHLTDWQGITNNYEKLQFTVPSGQNRLNASAAFQNSSTSLTARVRLTLIDPNGKLAAYSVPQGDGNYGNVQVTDPTPGTWTAYIYSRDSKDGGTTGTVLFGASSASYTSFGTVSPSTMTLAPGQSGAASLTVSTPSQPGDAAGSIVVRSVPSSSSAVATTTSVPVTLRSLIPAGSQSFSQTLTGGNGRAFFTGQSFYYQLNVAKPGGSLNASVALGDNADNPFTAFLVNPAGESVAFASNTLLDSSSPSGTRNVIGAQLHTLNAPAGRWTLIVVFAPQVSGTALDEPFTVSTDQTQVPRGSGGIPNSSATKLTAGQSYTYDVSIKNGGSSPEAYFADPRTTDNVSLPLTALFGDTSQEPLTISSNIPEYLVPTQTSQLEGTSTTTGSAPIQFDLGTFSGDPDILSSFGKTATASFEGNFVAQGPWDLVPVEYGAFGPAGGPKETATSGLTVTTRGFDPTVTSPGGDLWLASTNPAKLNSFTPVTANPSRIATIPVTIKPTGKSGTVVHGNLYIDDANFVAFATEEVPNGNHVAVFPYSYTVK
jgi:Peptidase inhibitor I9